MNDILSTLWELTRFALSLVVLIGAEFAAGVAIAMVWQAWRCRYGDPDLILWRLHAYGARDSIAADVYGRRSDDGYHAYRGVDDRAA